MKLTIYLASSLVLLSPYITGFVFQKTFNIIGASYNISRKDVLDILYTVKLISRGRYALNGYFDLKNELDDRQFFDLQVLYSHRSASNFKSIFYAFPNNTLSNYINGPYKLALMETLRKCDPKFLYFKGVWLPPLKPLRGEMHNCNITLDMVPFDQAPNGYYKFVLTASGMFDGFLEFTTLLD